MSYSLLAAAFFLLWNPEILLWDLLPDFIGFYLLEKGIAPLSPLSPSIESALLRFRKLAVISVLKTALLLPMISVSNSDPAMRLIFTVSFAVLRLFYLLPGFSDLFNGLAYLSDRAGGAWIQTGFLRRFTGLFFVLHYFLSCLPETVYLFIEENNVYDTVLYPLAAYYPAVTVVAAALSFILGAIWLCCILRFFKKQKRNAAWNSFLSGEIAALPHDGAERYEKVLRPALILFMFFPFANVVVNLDGFPLIPTMAAPLLLYFALRRLKKEIPIPKQATTLALITAAVGTLQYAAVFWFCQNYQEAASVLFTKVKDRFLIVAVGETVFELLMLFTIVACLARPLRRVIDGHTVLYWESSYLTHNSTAVKEQYRMRFRLRVGTLLLAAGIVSNAVTYWLLYTVPAARHLNAVYMLAVSVWFLRLLLSVSQAAKEKYAVPQPYDNQKTAE